MYKSTYCRASTPATQRVLAPVSVMLLLTFFHGGVLAAPFHHDSHFNQTAGPPSAFLSDYGNETTIVDVEGNNPAEFYMTHPGSTLQILVQSGTKHFFDPLMRFIQGLISEAADVYNNTERNFIAGSPRKLDMV